MTELKIKEKINNYLDKLPTSKLEEIEKRIRQGEYQES
jgi:hypothetical protein